MSTNVFSWKEFKLGDIAHLEYGNKFDKNKMTYKNPKINFVSRTANNNGVSDIVDEIDGVIPYSDGCITLAFGGSAGSCFLQEKPFYTGQNVGIITFPENVSKEAKLFIISALEKKCKLSFHAFGNEINKHFKTDLSIRLPVTETEEIDWDYMQEHIKELEQEHIAELEQYLSVTGLNDCELTDEDIEILSTKLINREGLRNSTSENDRLKEAKEFTIGDLFEVKTPLKRFNANTVKITDNIGHPYVVRSSNNNGVRGYIDEDEIYLNEGNTLSFGQDTATVFWQEKPYFTGDKIKVLKPKFDCNREIASYFISAITIAFSLYTWGSQSFKVSVIENSEILLPIACDETPDWEFMEKYIRAIEKVVIKDVVEFKDKIIK